MKKIVSILFVALIALAFMGCPTTYPDLDYDCLPVGDIMGDMENTTGLPLVTDKGSATATCSFTYDNDMTAWGGGSGVCNFKIRKTAGTWDGGDYGWATVAIGTLPSGVSAADNGGNIQLTGLKDGTTYNLTLNILAPTIVINLSEN